MHRTTPRFWRRFDRLPERVQRTARRNFRLLAENPAHPSLRFKKVGKFWSARVGLDYRALAVDDGKDFIWVWVGTHDEYDRLITS
ncbi:MAG: hypothetical protein OXS47_13915 [Chloroflexota bacterium]|nr:hypothetical protein [Chloroflexota bacterium]